MQTHSVLLQIMQKAVKRAGLSLLRDFNEVEKLQVSLKGPADFVSTADKRSEAIIKTTLNKVKPDFAFVGEETGVSGGGDHQFIVDPLDGTTNFLHGIPHWAIAVAYLYKNQPHIAVTYDPIKNEMFYAEKGKGAYLNDQRIRISGRARMRDAVFATGIPFLGLHEHMHGQYLARLSNIMAKTAGVRRFGSATLDLAYVATGRYEGFFEYGLNSWDIAGGILLVQEAGGFVVNENNAPYALQALEQQQWIIASNYALCKDFFQTFNQKIP